MGTHHPLHGRSRYEGIAHKPCLQSGTDSVLIDFHKCWSTVAPPPRREQRRARPGEHLRKLETFPTNGRPQKRLSLEVTGTLGPTCHDIHCEDVFQLPGAPTVHTRGYPIRDN